MLQPTTKNKFIVAFVFLAIAVVFGYIYYIRYFKWKDCIDEVLTSCTVEGAANATSGGAIWVIPTIIFTMLAVDRMLKALRARASDQQTNTDSS